MLHRGVYAVGHRDVSLQGNCLAAVLSIGPDAVVSQWSAAPLWEFAGADDALPVHVTVPRCLRQRDGLRLHPVRTLDPNDVTLRAGIRVTTPARTLLDIAAVTSDERVLRRVVHEAQVQRRASIPALQAQLARARNHRGAARLRALVAEGPTPTRSALEDETVALLRDGGFPAFRANEHVAGSGELDVVFDGLELVVEVDGGRYHDTWIRRREDAAKQARLEAAGVRVLRLSWWQVFHDKPRTVRRLWHAVRERQALAAGGARAKR